MPNARWSAKFSSRIYWIWCRFNVAKHFGMKIASEQIHFNVFLRQIQYHFGITSVSHTEMYMSIRCIEHERRMKATKFVFLTSLIFCLLVYVCADCYVSLSACTHEKYKEKLREVRRTNYEETSRKIFFSFKKSGRQRQLEEKNIK